LKTWQQLFSEFGDFMDKYVPDDTQAINKRVTKVQLSDSIYFFERMDKYLVIIKRKYEMLEDNTDLISPNI